MENPGLVLVQAEGAEPLLPLARIRVLCGEFYIDTEDSLLFEYSRCPVESIAHNHIHTPDTYFGDLRVLVQKLILILTTELEIILFSFLLLSGLDCITDFYVWEG